MSDERYRAPKVNRMPEPPEHTHVFSEWLTGHIKMEQYRYCLIKACAEVETRTAKG